MRQIPFGDRADDARHIADRLNKIANETVHRIETVGPSADGAGKRRSMPDFSFFSDDGADSFEFLGEPGIEFDDFIDRVVYLAGNPGAVHRQPRAEIAFAEVRQDPQKQTAIELLHEGERLVFGKFFSHI